VQLLPGWQAINSMLKNVKTAADLLQLFPAGIGFRQK
jgi:hypothetical protein